MKQQKRVLFLKLSNSIIIRNDIVSKAEEGEYFKNENKIVLRNEVRVEYDKGNIAAEKMSALLETEEYTFNDNVILRCRLEDKDFKLKAPYLLMYFTDNSFAARKGVIIEYNRRTIKGDNVKYNSKKKLLNFSGNVCIEEDNGDWVKGDKAVFYLEKAEFIVGGEVSMEVKINCG
ncbi:hypothetical protein [Halocella sp. SP3-1]|uniref:hypothetical protein n=1 Tax=Halocella sp. SP3-1 TaxID=2382161 RepID=UPI000F758F17|nr:hypothetical protein [Halocella sp. SP3-1]AZO93168.1 hypothetical protein D7D81_00335 [Halocella sp. SP3-1]